MSMRVLMVGDVVGKPGRRALKLWLAGLVSQFGIDVVVVNGENSAGGLGLTSKVIDELFRYGVHVITTGNHVWDKKEMVTEIMNWQGIVRPANYPPGVPGEGWLVHALPTGERLAVVNISGRVFMDNLDCPFQVMERLLPQVREQTPAILVDVHAEATSEKLAIAWFLDGRVSAVVGTHTHVQTADERILPNGTAYLTDVGMTGPYDGIIGMKRDVVMRRFLYQMPQRFEVASGPVQLNAVVVEIDGDTGRAVGIERIRRVEDGDQNS